MSNMGESAPPPAYDDVVGGTWNPAGQPAMTNDTVDTALMMPSASEVTGVNYRPPGGAAFSESVYVLTEAESAKLQAVRNTIVQDLIKRPPDVEVGKLKTIIEILPHIAAPFMLIWIIRNLTVSEAGDEDYDDDDESSDFHVWMRTLQESLLPLGFLVICYFCMFKQAIKSEVYQALRNIVSVEKLQSNFQENVQEKQELELHARCFHMKFVKGRGMVEKVKHREQRVVSFQGQEDMSGRLPDFRENTLVDIETMAVFPDLATANYVTSKMNELSEELKDKDEQVKILTPISSRSNICLVVKDRNIPFYLKLPFFLFLTGVFSLLLYLHKFRRTTKHYKIIYVKRFNDPTTEFVGTGQTPF